MDKYGKWIIIVSAVIIVSVIAILPVFAQNITPNLASITLEVTPENQVGVGQAAVLEAVSSGLGATDFEFGWSVTGNWWYPFPGHDGSNTMTQVPLQRHVGSWFLGVRSVSSPEIFDIIEYRIVLAPDEIGEHSIENIVLTPPSPATQEFGQYINFEVDYETANAGNVHIASTPMTDGSNSLNQGNIPANYLPTGSGSASGRFTIRDVGQTEPQIVDQVRFTMWCFTEGTLLEVIVDVDYTFIPPAEEPPSDHLIENIVFTPASPATLEFVERVNITFDYTTDHDNDVRVWVRPLTGGSMTPNWSGSGSPHYPTGSGSGTGFISVRDEGQTEAQAVDQVRFHMVCAATNALLNETLVDVDYTFTVPPTFLSGYEQVIHDLEIQANETLSYNMPSPEGKVPLFGGTNVLGIANHNVVICAMNPYFLSNQVAGWSVQVKNLGSGTHTVRIRGIFAEAPPGYEIYTDDFLVGYDPRLSVRNDHLIPADKVIISGGARPLGINWDFRMLESGPISEGDQHGWRVRMLNMGSSDYTVRMHAIAAYPLAGYEQVSENVSIPAAETRDVRIYAPDDQVIIGGGMSRISGVSTLYIRDLSPMHPMMGTTDGLKASMRNYHPLYDSNARVTAIFADLDN